MKYFIIFAAVAMITEIVSFFSLSVAILVKETDSFDHHLDHSVFG